MYLKWISMFIIAALATAVRAPATAAQVPEVPVFSFTLADEARELFNIGMHLYDQGKYVEAEKRFREVLQKFPRNDIADRTDYYLIRTLVKMDNLREALSRINSFQRQYPRSAWRTDVQEYRIQLTNELPPGAVARLQAPPAPPAPPVPEAPAPSRVRPVQTELSLQQEILRAIFRNNAERAIAIAAERLQSDPSDPVVLSNLHMVAESESPSALPMLATIAKSSSNAKARKDAIFWISRSRADKNSLVDVLAGLLPAAAEEEAKSLTFALSQISNEKSAAALAGIATDRNKPEKTRSDAIFWIGQSKAPNRIALLEQIYKGSSGSARIRNQVAFALRQSNEPQAVSLLSNIAASDPDIGVRKQALVWLGRIRTLEAIEAMENLLRKK